MTDTSAKLGLPYIASQQAQPEVTFAVALNMLQMLAYGVIDHTDTPPGGPAEGDLYLCDTAPTGAWAGRANHIAGYFGGAWVFLPGLDDAGSSIAMGASQEGLNVYVQNENAFKTWNGTTWDFAEVVLINSTVVGLGAASRAGRLRYCTNEAGGAVPVFDDGAAWRRVTDRVVAS